MVRFPLKRFNAETRRSQDTENSSSIFMALMSQMATMANGNFCVSGRKVVSLQSLVLQRRRWQRGLPLFLPQLPQNGWSNYRGAGVRAIFCCSDVFSVAQIRDEQAHIWSTIWFDFELKVKSEERELLSFRANG
jgi:hypothetical protein